MSITATHINYFIICQRKLWLFANGIQMEHTSDIVYDGKLLHETSYPQRPDKGSEMPLSANWNGIELNGVIDFYDSKNKIIHETKRSDKVEEAHEWQARFYIWLLELNGMEDAHAVIEYPKLRKTEAVTLNSEDKILLLKCVEKIAVIIASDNCPQRLVNNKICKSCSYYELCFVGE